MPQPLVCIPIFIPALFSANVNQGKNINIAKVLRPILTPKDSYLPYYILGFLPTVTSEGHMFHNRLHCVDTRKTSGKLQESLSVLSLSRRRCREQKCRNASCQRFKPLQKPEKPNPERFRQSRRDSCETTPRSKRIL